MDDIFSDIDLESNYFSHNYSVTSQGLGHDQYFDSDKFNNVYDNNYNSDFKMIHVNIRSLPKNGNTFVSFLETLRHKYQVICFSETWLNSNRQIENLFPEYNQFHSMRPATQFAGGGVAILVHESLQSTELDNLSCNTEYIECIFVKITKSNESIVVGSCYRRPVLSNENAFISALSGKISTLTGKIAIAGDFNFNLLNIDNDVGSSSFIDSMLSLGLVHTISKPTRDINNAISLLDNIFISNSIPYSSGLFLWDVSDHYPVFVFMKNVFTSQNEVEKIKYRLVNTVTLNNMAESLSNHNLQEEILNCVNLDCAVEKLDEILMFYFNLHCPIITKRITRREREKPWIDLHIRRLIKCRENSYKSLKNGSISLVFYKQFRNFVTKQITDSKKRYLTNLLDSIKSNMKKTWSVLNGLLKPKLNNNISHIKSILLEGTVFEDGAQIGNLLNHHFSTIGSKISQSFEPSDHFIASSSSILNSFFFHRVTPNEVAGIIDKLKNKSCHIDYYPSKVLKFLNPILSPILAYLVNKSLSEGHYPRCFKIARVIPLHKGDRKDDVNNYRPISILPILGKIFERIVYNQLYYFLEKYNLLHCNQFGFRKNRSTIDAVMDQLDFVYNNLDQGNAVISIFMDFSKAFDCLDHVLLLKKLFHYGVRGITNLWFKSYLSNRSQFVFVNDINSSTLPISHGVPQGSILGPLLFLLFINDFPNSNPFFKFSLFADDSTLTCKFANGNESIMKSKLENELIPVYHWLKMNKIKINLNKSKFMAFSYGKTYCLNELKMGNGLITATDNTKFLGIILDKNLNFKAHTSAVCSKVSKVVGLLFRLNNILPKETLLTLYSSLLVPHLLYGIEIWYGALQINKDRIFKLQKKAIRAVNCLPYNHHTNDFFKSMELLKLEDIYKQKLLVNMFKNQNLTTLSDIHGHNTRHRNDILLPRFNRTRTQLSCFYQGILNWNSLPDDIKSLQYVTAFKNSVKNLFLDLY